MATSATRGDVNVGGIITFRFGTVGGFDIKVLELEPAKRVLWPVVAGPAEWIGTKVSVDLRPDDDATVTLLRPPVLLGAPRTLARSDTGNW